MTESSTEYFNCNSNGIEAIPQVYQNGETIPTFEEMQELVSYYFHGTIITYEYKYYHTY